MFSDPFVFSGDSCTSLGGRTCGSVRGLLIGTPAATTQGRKKLRLYRIDTATGIARRLPSMTPGAVGGCPGDEPATEKFKFDGTTLVFARNGGAAGSTTRYAWTWDACLITKFGTSGGTSKTIESYPHVQNSTTVYATFTSNSQRAVSVKKGDKEFRYLAYITNIQDIKPYGPNDWVIGRSEDGSTWTEALKGKDKTYPPCLETDGNRLFVSRSSNVYPDRPYAGVFSAYSIGDDGELTEVASNTTAPSGGSKTTTLLAHSNLYYLRYTTGEIFVRFSPATNLANKPTTSKLAKAPAGDPIWRFIQYPYLTASSTALYAAWTTARTVKMYGSGENAGKLVNCGF